MEPGRGGMFIWFKLGKKRPEMEVRTCARIKKVIWDQLLATKAEIIQSLSCIDRFHVTSSLSKIQN